MQWVQSRSCRNFMLGGEFGALRWCWTSEALLPVVLTKLCALVLGDGGLSRKVGARCVRQLPPATASQLLHRNTFSLPSTGQVGGQEHTQPILSWLKHLMDLRRD